MNTSAILVVDNDRLTRSHLSRFLSSRGYRVDCLDSVELLFEHVAVPNRRLAVILDISMPNANGLHILAQTTQLVDPVPVLAISAVGDVRTVLRAMWVGARDYLIKPFEDRELERSLEQILEKERVTASYAGNGFRVHNGIRSYPVRPQCYSY